MLGPVTSNTLADEEWDDPIIVSFGMNENVGGGRLSIVEVGVFGRNESLMQGWRICLSSK
jgi:hypothetical protein